MKKAIVASGLLFMMLTAGAFADGYCGPQPQAYFGVDAGPVVVQYGAPGYYSGGYGYGRDYHRDYAGYHRDNRDWHGNDRGYRDHRR